METEAVFEAGDVVVSVFPGIVWGVDADTQVGPDHQVTDVVTQAETGAQRNFAPQSSPGQFGSRAVFVFFQQPDIARIYE